MKIKKSIKLIGTTMLLSSLVVGGNLITSCSKNVPWKNYDAMSAYLDAQPALNIGDGTVFNSDTGAVLTFMKNSITVKAIMNGEVQYYYDAIATASAVIPTFKWKIENGNTFHVQYEFNGNKFIASKYYKKTSAGINIINKSFEDESWKKTEFDNAYFKHVSLNTNYKGTSQSFVECEIGDYEESIDICLRPIDFNATFIQNA